jgi:hypothetical protein
MHIMVFTDKVYFAMNYSSGLLTSYLILFVAYLLHPVDRLAVELFLNGDMCHGRSRRGTMPMLFTRWYPNYVARMNFLDRAILALYQTAVVTIRIWPSGWVCHAVREPGSNVTLAPTTRAGSFAWNKGSMRTLPVKYSAEPLVEGCEPLRLMSIFRCLALNVIFIICYSSVG